MKRPLPDRLRTHFHSTGEVCARSGFTLIELLLVLGIVASIAMVVMPRIDRQLQRSAHLQAAEGIEIVLSQLRQRAIQTGLPHSFRFVSRSGEYEVQAIRLDEVKNIDFEESLDQPDVPENGNPDDTNRGDGQIEGSLVDGMGIGELIEDDLANGPLSSEGDLIERRRLEGEIVFLSSEDSSRAEADDSEADASLAETENSAFLDDDSLPDITDENRTDQNMSEPIVFYPDGRADDATFALYAPTGYTIEVTVVGLTGKIRIGARRRLQKESEQLLASQNLDDPERSP